jgi:hypothetical protein
VNVEGVVKLWQKSGKSMRRMVVYHQRKKKAGKEPALEDLV